MTVKEKNDYITDKWKDVVCNLSDKRSQIVKFSKILENTAVNSNRGLMKLSLSIIMRLLSDCSSVKYSATSRKKLLLGKIEKYTIIDVDTIMPDGFSLFIESLSKTMLEKFNSEFERMNHIKLEINKNYIEAYLVL